MTRSQISANLNVGEAMRSRMSYWLLIFFLFTMSGNALCTSISGDDDVGCACADKRLRSGYLTRSMIESQNALAILKKIDAGDVAGASLLASEIMKASKDEMKALLSKEATTEEVRSMQKIIDNIDKYLDRK